MIGWMKNAIAVAKTKEPVYIIHDDPFVIKGRNLVLMLKGNKKYQYNIDVTRRIDDVMESCLNSDHIKTATSYCNHLIKTAIEDRVDKHSFMGYVRDKVIEMTFRQK